MKSHGINPFYSGIGVISGTLIGVSLFVVANKGPISHTGAAYPFKLESLQMASFGISDDLKNAAAHPTDRSGIEDFLVWTSQNVMGRHLTVVEISKKMDAEKLIHPALDWQEKSTNKRDIIFYIAPIDKEPSAEQDLAHAIQSVLKTRAVQFPLINRRTTYVFHSDLNERKHSLDSIVKYSHLEPNKLKNGLLHVKLDGPIEKLAWIRTTIIRWNVLDGNGFRLAGSRIDPTEIAASLIDPTRNTLTYIDLLSLDRFKPIDRAST